MQQKLLKHLLAAIVLCYTIACLPSCKKPEPEYTYVNEQQKAYFDWKVGSYWVFYDSVAGRVDSLSVTKYKVNPPDAAANVGHQNIVIIINGFYPGHGTDTTEWNLLQGAPDGTYLTIDVGNKSVNYSPFTLQFPFYIGSYPRDLANYPKITTTFISSLSIGGNVYYDVYKIIFIYKNNKYNDTFYLNYDSGFVAVFFNNEFFKKRLYLLKSRKAL